MPPTALREAPALESFTPLAEHQSQTPTSFYSAKPVLHYHAVGARAIASRDQISKLPIFASTTESQAQPTTDAAEPVSPERAVTVEVVDAFINSEQVSIPFALDVATCKCRANLRLHRNLTLFNQTTTTGISIPYPAISLHAIQRLADPANPSEEIQGLYMQLELSDPYGMDEDDEMDAIELTLIPPPSAATDAATSGIQALFDAVSNCSNLHPDPTDQDDEDMEDEGDSRIVFEGSVGYEGISGLPGVQQGALDGGLPPPFPGSGGWITAENVSEYFDEEGNWIGDGNGEALGEGAGRVRTRDEVDGDGVNGHGEHDSDDSKRPRTD
jgi:nucleotide-sensitive chloride channel 1A